ncbi:MAG: septal ring lytic transglycosylase RlpA family protein [Burkholderiales bacterium]|nr:septal ring lytic transglycosylase RlpA family protein [Burkholderiales bacterium]
MIIALVCALLAACSGSGRRGGAYYMDDGPEANPPANLDAVPDAVPRIEPLARGPNNPYTIFGQRYVPDTSGQPYRAQGPASWYGKKYHGKPTSNGERYDMYGMTAAHPTLPIPSYVRVTRVATGKTVVLRINDRGPFLGGRVIDLSYVAAHKLGVLSPGSAEVIVERIMPQQIANGTALAASAPAAAASPPIAARPAPLAPPVTLTPAPAPTTPSLAATGPSVATLPLAAAPASSATPAAAGSVYLQLGAFSDPARAQAIAARAAAQVPTQAGVSVNVELGAGNLHRVRVGPFASTEAATQAAGPLENALGVAPRVTGP